jgi:hypothetical protein
VKVDRIQKKNMLVRYGSEVSGEAGYTMSGGERHGRGNDPIEKPGECI